MKYFLPTLVAYVLAVCTIHYVDDKPWEYAIYVGAICMSLSILIVGFFHKITAKKPTKSS